MAEKFTVLTSTAVPVQVENIDTDQIIPARFLKATSREGFGENLFRDWRYDENGSLRPGFPMNDARFKGWEAAFLICRSSCYGFYISSIPHITTFISFHKHFQNIGFNQDFATNL